MDRTIARWNLRAYETGKQETLDTEYLAGLSPDVLAAPWQVEQLDAIRKQQSERRPDLVRLEPELAAGGGKVKRRKRPPSELLQWRLFYACFWGVSSERR